MAGYRVNLITLLIRLFPSLTDLERMVTIQLGQPLDHIIPFYDRELDKIVPDLVDWAIANTRMIDLVRAVATEVNPHDFKLQEGLSPLLESYGIFTITKSWGLRLRADQVMLQQLQQQLAEAEKQQTALEDTNSALQDRLARSNDARNRLRRTLDEQDALNRRLEQQLVEKEKELADIKGQLAAADKQIDLSRRVISDWQNKNRQLETDLVAARARIADLEVKPADPPPVAVPTYPERLTAAQHKAGHPILLTAFTGRADLALLTRQVLDVSLNTISNDANLSSVLTDLLDWVEAKGRLPDLLAGVAEANPDNKRLQRWLAGLRAEGQ